MYGRFRVGVVYPAYNAVRTLEEVVSSIPENLVDAQLLVDDASQDGTVALAAQLGIPMLVHPQNRGYGANQKTCYAAILDLKPTVDIIVMLHPDAQYPAYLLPALIAPIADGTCDLTLGSRFADLDPRHGGMPTYKYYANRLLTLGQNAVLRTQLTEFHTGYRVFSRHVLESLPLHRNSNDFKFDVEVLTQCVDRGYRIGEVASPARYFRGASSVGPWASIKYGLGVVETTAAYWAHRRGIRCDDRFGGCSN
ncbi:MAG: glycosyltransferase family 2 protein [Sandaracinaceae bacterium]|nr:glycosyltransferase family 2 protein [Sandaracinaceae bacterium]MBK7154563.1 glycosyltransferase family 2 protein [Sandaracinaceae bacterium]MBK7775540.1 glycosyltransferase family 2 protein [Sandaracinaceae bacterium]MBK8406482.1 glycosyltransferase family 2 protein [Sandaracinaceae bacterium]MBP7681885.1 glycosyltransferase family 2 protein [Deltaproteobacteria bacterium]